MRFRPAPLKQAAILAAVFVLARVVYRVLFDGAGGSGPVLLALPRVRLEGPFAFVALLGPVTADGLWSAAYSALPFAAVILGFGVLNALVDVQPWFVRASRRGPLRSVSRSLVIAWQTLPALASSVRRARIAAALRGERPGPSLLAPVFENTIERAIALAASMELRGFAASRRLEGACERPIMLRDAVLERGGWRLAVPDLALFPGTLAVLHGPTGSGKSSLLGAITGLFQHVDDGTSTGTVLVGDVDRAAVPPRETAAFVGAVTQQVRLSFVAETVAEEIGFALAVRGVASVIVAERVRETAEHLGIRQLLGRAIHELSAGEAELVAIASAVVERPSVLVVDEPLAELDASARPLVVAALERLAHETGVCVVVAEHRTAWFAGIADAWIGIADGIAAIGAPPPERQARSTSGIRASDVLAATAEIAVEVRALTVHHGERLAVDEVRFELCAGELVALHGPNGAGKSSLLHALALPNASGAVRVRGADVHTMRPRARHAAVALVPEALEDLFVTTSAEEDCRRADRRAGRKSARAGAAAIFAELLDVDGERLELLLRTHPRDLSGGERLCLALALQLTAQPAVLLVDEPARGLDETARAQASAALARAAGHGAAVLFATHEHGFADALATRTLRLEAGRLVETQQRRAAPSAEVPA